MLIMNTYSCLRSGCLQKLFLISCILFIFAFSDSIDVKAQKVPGKTTHRTGLKRRRGSWNSSYRSLKVMEEAGLRPDIITGVSMGSIIGGMYSLGYSADSLEKIFKSLNWKLILSNKISENKVIFLEKQHFSNSAISLPLSSRKVMFPSGLINGQQVENVLSFYSWPAADIYDFSKLPIPFMCVATDIVNFKIVDLKKGYLSDAIRASFLQMIAKAEAAHHRQHGGDAGAARARQRRDALQRGVEKSRPLVARGVTARRQRRAQCIARDILGLESWVQPPEQNQAFVAGRTGPRRPAASWPSRSRPRPARPSSNDARPSRWPERLALLRARIGRRPSSSAAPGPTQRARPWPAKARARKRNQAVQPNLVPERDAFPVSGEGSGNSPNVLRAMGAAKDHGCVTVGVCGYQGGKLKALADHCFHVKVDDMQIVEDVHMILVHILMKILCVGKGS